MKSYKSLLAIAGIALASLLTGCGTFGPGFKAEGDSGS